MKGRAAQGVSPRNRLVLWTRAGGRCQYEGCNESLLGDIVSGAEALNKAFVAHIVAAAPDGPRGHPERSHQLADTLDNLMLLCHAHHKLIDDEQTSAAYDVARLTAMKAAHEDRIARVTAIDPSRETHIVHYAARVGEHDCLVSPDAGAAVLPERYPASSRPISLELKGSDYADHEQAYWDFQVDTLRRQFALKVGERLRSGDIGHLSVFAIAPQPLLIELGRLLSDIAAVEVRQLAREPRGWAWREGRPAIDFVTRRGEPSDSTDVALVVGVSAAIDDARVRAVLGADCPIWSIEAAAPGNDVLARPTCLVRFRNALRATFAEIGARHGSGATIHVFPALPVAMAVEVGRVWMPKADPPLILYDEQRGLGGFIARHRIGAAAATPPPAAPLPAAG